MRRLWLVVSVLLLPGSCLMGVLAVAAGATVVLTTQAGSNLDAHTAMTRPVVGGVVSLPFGCTTLAFELPDRSCPGGFRHTGVDLSAASGTPVVAALDGTARVVHALTGYGLHVIIDHGGGLTTLYGHLDSVAVSDGESVSTGERIGTVGSTGNSTGPHLHFEVRRDGVAVDPQDYVGLP